MKKFLFLFFLPCIVFGQENSLKNSVLLKDTAQIMAFIRKTQALPDSLGLQIIENSDKIIESSKAISFKKGLAYGHSFRASTHFVFGNYDLSLADYQKAVELADAVPNPNFLTNSLFYLGKIHENRQNFSQTLPYYQKAIENAKKHQNKRMENIMLGQIGNLYGLQGDFKRQLSYNLKALQEFELLKDSGALISSYNDVGFGYGLLKKYDSAIFFTEKSVKIAEHFLLENYLTAGYGNLAEYYFSLKNYPKSIFYAEKGLKIAQKIRSKTSAAQNVVVLYQNYKQNGQSNKALDYLEILSQLKDSIYNKNQMEAIQKLETNFTIKQKQKENQALQLENQLKVQELSQQKTIALTAIFGVLILAISAAMLLKTNQNRKKINEFLQQKNLEIEKQKGILQENNTALQTAYSEIQAQKQEIEVQSKKLQENNTALQTAYSEIQEQKQEIEVQSKKLQENNVALQTAYSEIQLKSKKITDSINYAQRIQGAILPTFEKIAKAFDKDFFVFYKPKDIVSGDFYFFEQIDMIFERSDLPTNANLSSQEVLTTKNFVAVADCTGHGVPGAFMSMIAYQILHEIIANKRIFLPNQILNKLHQGIRKSLRQDQNQSRDGLDIVLVAISENEYHKKIQYSGAMNPLYGVQNGGFFELKATKKSIGGYQNEENLEFELHEQVLEQPSILYLCSDGYADQFGGAENQKFSSKNLKKLLLQISDLPMHEQEKILMQTIESHQNQSHEKQIDDMTILGLRIG